MSSTFTRVITPEFTGSATSEFWHHRELLRSLVVRNLKVKYQRSALGFVWTLLNPLATVAILAAVFTHIVRIPLEDYWAFLLSGYFVWNFAIQTLNTGTYAFGEQASLIRSAAFPAIFLVLGQALAKLVEFAVAMTLMLAILAVFHHGGVPAAWLLLPLLLVIQFLIVVGLTLPVASLSAFYYDVQHALPIALTTLFYVSPVFYAAELVPESVRWLYMLNPLAVLMTLFHEVVYRGHMPSAALLAGGVAMSVVLFGIGYALFNRYTAVYAEVI